MFAPINWAANTTAEYAVDRWEELAELGPSEKLKRLKAARFEDRDQAARRGTDVQVILPLHAVRAGVGAKERGVRRTRRKAR